MLSDKHCIMITGAAGSIGSQLCRQLAAEARAASLVLFDSSEYALYRIDRELRERFPGMRALARLGDVRDRVRVGNIMSSYRPDIVLHAAAYKHVPMAEVNAWETVRTNALGTHVVAQAAQDAEVKRFVLISTDKAVRPVNVMGASKRLAELILQTMPRRRTAFVAVRFGNVAGSSGSVLPLFREQIASGGPVTVTHPEVTRYMMSIEQAVELVLQAARSGTHGEIVTLGMGEPVSILDLAREAIREAGSPAAIRFTGLRPGEKLHEDLSAEPTPGFGAQWRRAALDWLYGAEPQEVKQELLALLT